MPRDATPLSHACFNRFRRTLLPRLFAPPSRQDRSFPTVDRVLLLWRSRALRSVLDTGQLAAPPPAGLNPGKVKRFPILGEAIYRAVAQGERRRMLERLYPDYEDLSSLPHGLPHSNLLKGLLSPGSITGAFERQRCQECDRARFHQHHSVRYCIHGKVSADVSLLAGVLKRGRRFF